MTKTKQASKTVELSSNLPEEEDNSVIKFRPLLNEKSAPR